MFAFSSYGTRKKCNHAQENQPYEQKQTKLDEICVTYRGQYSKSSHEEIFPLPQFGKTLDRSQIFQVPKPTWVKKLRIFKSQSL